MSPVFKAVCSVIIMLEGIAVLWLAKLLASQSGIDSFYDGVNAVINTLLSLWS